MLDHKIFNIGYGNVNKITMDEPGAGLRYKNNNTIREKNE